MEKLYCTIFIVDISQNPEEVDTITSRIQQLIEDHGGVIKRTNPWGKKRLAYPIKGRTSAFYVEIEFSANSHLNIPATIEAEYRLNDRVLRYLTYVVTKKELIQREMNAKRMKGNDARGHGGPPRRGAGKPVEEPKEEKPAEEAKATEEKPAAEEKPATEEVVAEAKEVVEEAAEKAADTAEAVAEEATEAVEEAAETVEEAESKEG